MFAAVADVSFRHRGDPLDYIKADATFTTTSDKGTRHSPTLFSNKQYRQKPRMPGLTNFPTFPNDVPTHPLLIIDYQLLLKNDQEEIDRLWKAATELGFW